MCKQCVPGPFSSSASKKGLGTRLGIIPRPSHVFNVIHNIEKLGTDLGTMLGHHNHALISLISHYPLPGPTRELMNGPSPRVGYLIQPPSMYVGLSQVYE